MSVEIVDTNRYHLLALRGRLRAGDCLEIAATGASQARAIWRSYRASVVSRTGIVDGKVAAVWGCAGPVLGGVGEPWLLTAPEVERVPLRFVRQGREELARMLSLYPVLQNYVAADYKQACRFLEVLGFTLGEPIACGPHMALFRQFTARR